MPVNRFDITEIEIKSNLLQTRPVNYHTGLSFVRNTGWSAAWHFDRLDDIDVNSWSQYKIRYQHRSEKSKLFKTKFNNCFLEIEKCETFRYSSFNITIKYSDWILRVVWWSFNNNNKTKRIDTSLLNLPWIEYFQSVLFRWNISRFNPLHYIRVEFMWRF